MIAACIAAWLACCAVFAFAIITAPLGWEDADGWHPGEPEGE